MAKKTRSKSGLSKYYTNKAVRKSIDRLLFLNARNVANFGTNSKYDLKTDESLHDAWVDIELKIEELDEDFYKTIKRHEDND